MAAAGTEEEVYSGKAALIALRDRDVLQNR